MRIEKGMKVFLLVVVFVFAGAISFGAALGSNYPASGKFAPVSASAWGTGTWALGSNFDGTNTTFAVYSANATKILLEIYATSTGSIAVYDYWMVKGSDNIWRAKLSGNCSATSTATPKYFTYGFRAWGPNWPFSTSWARGNSAAGFITDCDANGNRFNPNKVLYDPYGKEMSHDKEIPAMTAAGENGGMYGTGGADVGTGMTYKGPITGNVAINRRNVDTGKWAPKSYVINDSTSFGTKPARAQKDAIIYEAHVRGLTQHASSTSLATIMSGIATVDSVPASYRGTYKGAGYMAKYLKAMGYNTIELLPVHETANDTNSSTSAGGNFWGYMTYSYFAPDRRYSYDKKPGGPTKEFKAMVAAFHAAGIEVYLDVVFNHTGEGGTWGNSKVAEITSFRGFDNREYYALTADNQNFWETTGCGNNFRCDTTAGRKVVMDSLTYWVDKMGVDGYRFDLAPVIGRWKNGTDYPFSSSATTLTQIASLASTKNIEVIAEAWDCSTYQVANFPSGWGEWNGFYRDTMRRYLKGSGDAPSFADRFNGSYNNFNDQGGPHKSVNFVTAHDGFTLMDLVSYNSKMNGGAYPFGISDGGSSDNDSWDSNGDQALRRKQLRNIWTWQMFSRGVPMSVYGDEFGRTQNGNNNPYNLDSIATWNNYSMINTNSPNTVSTGYTQGYHNNFGTDAMADGKNNLLLFTKYVNNVRANTASLRCSDYSAYYDFKSADGTRYLNNTDRCIRVQMPEFLVMINTWTSQVNFTVPAAPTGKRWVRIIDTDTWAEGSANNCWTTATGATISGSYGVNAWSTVVLQAVP